ncbi:hypothetical protein ASF47_03930 [Nocardioides sp. Leaf285]|nr:hypothetical protein ASF47_03930 [Nocardioides sp. Leaf285]
MHVQHDSAGFLRPLEELLAVARTGHVTDAAAELGVPQPTLSRSLARLSAEVGAPLLLRRGRGIALSRHGRLLADAAERAVAEVEEALRAIRAEVDPGAGRVRLGFQHALGADLVPRALRVFHDRHPRVTLQLAEGGAEHLVADVAGGRLDLALVAVLEPSTGTGLASLVLGTQPLRVLLPRGHHLAGPGERGASGRGSRGAEDGRAGPVALADLAEEPFVAMATGYGLRTITDAMMREAGAPRRPAYECEDLATAGGLVAAGLGFTVVPAGVDYPGTVEVALDAGARRAERVVQLVWSSAGPPAPVTALRDVLEETLPGLLGASPPRDDRAGRTAGRDAGPRAGHGAEHGAGHRT